VRVCHYVLVANQFLRTPKEARDWLERHGVTASEWARAHGFDAAVVFSLLSGRTRGKHGQAHRAAVALRLKPGPAGEEESPLDHDSSQHPAAETKTGKLRREEPRAGPG
jgi:gp16 family phage-associated protein